MTRFESTLAKQNSFWDRIGTVNTESLLNKGIQVDTIDKAMDEWRAQGGMQNEEAMIRQILEKKKYHSDCELKEKYKIYTYLLRKGFSLENVNKVLGRMDSFT